MSQILMTMPDDYFRMYDIIRVSGQWVIVVKEDRCAGPASTEYTLLHIDISKYWPINKIQLWALRKAFKNI